MKKKLKEKFVLRFMGLDVILRADFPKELKSREEKRLTLAAEELSTALCTLYGVGVVK